MIHSIINRGFSHKMSRISIFIVCITLLISTLACGQSFKPRIIVTTDITNEPDDQESLVRLLVYSNNYDIEALIGSTGIWKLSDPATHVIRECVDAYSKVRENLVLHDKNYPTGQYLHSITATGNAGYGMSAVGERGSNGANMIIESVDKEDPRTVWLLAWGGANTIAQALWTVIHTRNEEAINKFVSKIRIYDLAGQDDAGAWIAKTFPGIYIIRNVLAYKGMSFRFSSTDWDHTRGGDESVVSRDWVKQNIQQGHGALGNMYPDALHIWEGDSPTFLFLMQNGLNDPEQQWQGSWGGRFGRQKSKNVNVLAQEYAGADCAKGCWVNEEPYLDYWMYADAYDSWSYENNTYNNQYCTILRWRTDFQNDFAARMDWCVNDYKNANHNPVAIINNDDTKQVLYQKTKIGASVSIDASDSYDPDGDKISYDWWIYKEAGTYTEEVPISNNSSSLVQIEMPQDASGKTIHLILTLRDSGSPQLTTYRRVVLTGDRDIK